MPITGLNLCYLSSTPFSTKRVTLIASADTFQPAIIEAMKEIAIWKGADKRRTTGIDSLMMVGDQCLPEVQELGWEINPEDADRVFAAMDSIQKPMITNATGYRKMRDLDNNLARADELMSEFEYR